MIDERKLKSLRLAIELGSMANVPVQISAYDAAELIAEIDDLTTEVKRLLDAAVIERQRVLALVDQEMMAVSAWKSVEASFKYLRDNIVRGVRP